MENPASIYDKPDPRTLQPGPPVYPQFSGGPAPGQQPGSPGQAGYLGQPAYPPQPVYPTTHNATNTTVVIQQQPQVLVQTQQTWSSGLCACFEDCGVCLLGFCCLCILECTVSSNAGECCCVGSMCPIALRTKIRTRHNIQGSIMDDCCTLYWCGPCAMCQMARELNTRGI